MKLIMVYEYISKRMDVIWKCVKLCDGKLMHMMVHGCICALMDVYERIWW